jgi:hypothetical protein
LRCGLNASLAAETLIIHRNTFNYRLAQFIDKTGLISAITTTPSARDLLPARHPHWFFEKDKDAVCSFSFFSRFVHYAQDK